MAGDTGFCLGHHMNFLVAVVWVTEEQSFLDSSKIVECYRSTAVPGLCSAYPHVSQATKSALRSNESDAGCAVTTHRDLCFQELCVQEQDILIGLWH